MSYPDPTQPGTLAERLVPDELWDAIHPLFPPKKVRPQGGGAKRSDDRPLLVGIVYITTTGTAWRKVPPWCGVAHASLYRRFTEWTTAAVWTRLLDSLTPDHDPHCWCRAVALLAMQHAADQPGRQVHKRERRLVSVDLSPCGTSRS